MQLPARRIGMASALAVVAVVLVLLACLFLLYEHCC
jgi:cbb3-type cytochrome oxidase subunit 3